LKIDEEVEKFQVEKLKRVKSERDNEKVKASLKELKTAASENKNIIPYIFDSVKTYATLQEIADTLREVFGEYQASTIL